MKLKSRLPMFLLNGMFLLLSLFASSCFWAKSLPGEGYQGHHVYLLRDYGEAEKWLEKAAAQGDAYAEDLLKDLKE